MSILIVKVEKSLLHHSLSIQLDGIVGEDVVSEVNKALDQLRSSVLSLQRSLPRLRYADGFWCLTCSSPQKFWTTIMTETLALPLIKLGYRMPKRPMIYGGPDLSAADEVAALLDALRAQSASFTLARDDEVVPYRPARKVEGGENALLSFHDERSIEAKPATRFDLGSRRSIVFGLGWDNLHNRIYESIYGAGSPPDLDVVVYCVNRWGEVLHRLSPKFQRELPVSQRSAAVLRGAKTKIYHSAIKVSKDSTSGDAQDDDELVVVNLDQLDPSICAVLVTASLVGGARDLRYIQNLYGRVLDVSTEASELELCRLRIDTESAPPDSKTVAVFRLDRGALDEEDASEVPWTLETIGGFCELANPALPYVKSGDTLVSVRCGLLSIPICMTDFSISAFFEGGVFGTNLSRIRDAAEHCGPLTLTFKSIVADSDDDTYDLVFDDDPSEHIEFEAQRLQWSSLANLIGWSSSVGVPAVNYVKSGFCPHLTGTGLKPFLGQFGRSNLPDRVILSHFAAFIYAKDLGGTSDAYIRAWYKTLNISTGRLVKEVFEHEIARSKVYKKTKCPALVDFEDFSLCLPIESLVSKIAPLIITVRDKDWGIGAIVDDTILRHQIDLSDFRCGRSDDFLVQPDWVDDINDVKANAGFTKDMVVLKYKATLLYPGEEAPSTTGVINAKTFSASAAASSASSNSPGTKSSSGSGSEKKSSWGFGSKKH